MISNSSTRNHRSFLQGIKKRQTILAEAFIGFLPNNMLPKRTGKGVAPISPTMRTFIEQITFQSCAYRTNKKELYWYCPNWEIIDQWKHINYWVVSNRVGFGSTLIGRYYRHMGGSQLIMRFFGMNEQLFNYLMDRWKNDRILTNNRTIMSQPNKDLDVKTDTQCLVVKLMVTDDHGLGFKTYGDRWPWPGIFLFGYRSPCDHVEI